MSSMYIFCESSELRDWIVELAKHQALGILTFGENEIGELVSKDDFDLRDDIYRVFLFPQLKSPGANITLNDVNPREWGWVDVRPGALRKSESEMVLLYSEIHGEKCERDQCNPDKWVAWLKKQVKSEVHVGVVGRNIVHGGESKYSDIWFTDKAKALLDTGVVWKQFADANSVFEPAHQ